MTGAGRASHRACVRHKHGVRDDGRAGGMPFGKAAQSRTVADLELLLALPYPGIIGVLCFSFTHGFFFILPFFLFFREQDGVG
jgi:hypothetical protein